MPATKRHIIIFLYIFNPTSEVLLFCVWKVRPDFSLSYMVSMNHWLSECQQTSELNRLTRTILAISKYSNGWYTIHNDTMQLVGIFAELIRMKRSIPERRVINKFEIYIICSSFFSITSANELWSKVDLMNRNKDSENDRKKQDKLIRKHSNKSNWAASNGEKFFGTSWN